MNCAQEQAIINFLFNETSTCNILKYKNFFIMNIIPAIDLKKGKVVKAVQGDRASYKPIDLITSIHQILLPLLRL